MKMFIESSNLEPEETLEVLKTSFLLLILFFKYDLKCWPPFTVLCFFIFISFVTKLCLLPEFLIFLLFHFGYVSSILISASSFQILL